MGIFWGLFFGVRRMMKYVRTEYRRQSLQPREGLLASLIQAEEAGDRLSEDELVAMVFLLLAAGHETTLAPDCPERARAPRPSGAARRAQGRLELGRLGRRRTASLHLLRPSRPSRDMPWQTPMFHGQPIRRGQMIFACLAAANADPAVFGNPERLDIRRNAHRHLAFGAGIHVCLGAKLARTEIEIALERLFTRFPDLRLAVPRSALRYSTRPGTRALLELPVRP